MAVTTMKKITWWNQKRVECNIRYKDLEEALGGNYSTWGSYFSGEVMPSDYTIHKLCDFFDVEFTEGKHHFEEDHRTWKSEYHKAKSSLKSGTPEPTAKLTTIREVKPKTDIFGLVYGKVDYKVFLEFCNAVAQKNEDPMKIIYTKVSYEEFRKIERELLPLREVDHAD